MQKKQLKGKGKADYDYKHDILLFKTKEREYAKSIELGNIIVDIDKDDFLVGIQIFEASKFLNLERKMLLSIPNWQFTANVYEGTKIDIRLMFQIKVRNKIIEKNPIILQSISEKLPDSQLICEATA